MRFQNEIFVQLIQWPRSDLDRKRIRVPCMYDSEGPMRRVGGPSFLHHESPEISTSLTSFVRDQMKYLNDVSPYCFAFFSRRSPQSESDAQDGGVIQETDEIITKKKKGCTCECLGLEDPLYGCNWGRPISLHGNPLIGPSILYLSRHPSKHARN